LYLILAGPQHAQRQVQSGPISKIVSHDIKYIKTFNATQMIVAGYPWQLNLLFGVSW